VMACDGQCEHRAEYERPDAVSLLWSFGCADCVLRMLVTDVVGRTADTGSRSIDGGRRCRLSRAGSETHWNDQQACTNVDPGALSDRQGVRLV